MGPGGPEIWFLHHFSALLITKTSHADLLHHLMDVGLDFETGFSLLLFGTDIFYMLQAQCNEDSVLEAPHHPLPSAGILTHLDGALGSSVVPPSQLEKRPC